MLHLRRRWLVIGAAAAILVGLTGIASYVLFVRYQGRDVVGSRTVEFDAGELPSSPPRSSGRRAKARPTTAAAARARGEAVLKRTAVWPMYGFSPRRTRIAPNSALVPPFRPVWTFHGRALLEFPPVVAYGRLYVPVFDGRVYALDAATGKHVWEFDAGRCAWASPAVGGHLVFQTFVGHTPGCRIANSTENEGEVVAFDAETGRIRWRTETGSNESSPLLVGRRIFVGDWTGYVMALDAVTGRVIWRYRTDGQVKGSAAYDDGRVYIGSYDGHVYALDARSGKLVWRASAQPRLGTSGTFYSTPAVAYGRIYIGSTDGKVYSFGADSGSLRWSFRTGGYIYSAPAVWNELVLIGSYDHTFYALDAATGRPRWKFRSNGRITGAATVLNGVVYFSTLAERTYALDARTGRLLWAWPDGKYSPVVADAKHLYLVGYGRMWAMVPRRA